MSHPQIGNLLTFKLLHWSTDASSSIPDCIHPGGSCRPVQSSLYTTFPTITLALATIGLSVWTNPTSHTFTWTLRLRQIESYFFPKLPLTTHVVSNQYEYSLLQSLLASLSTLTILSTYPTTTIRRQRQLSSRRGLDPLTGPCPHAY